MLNLKPARRQAYRYGQQIRQLCDLPEALGAVQAAYGSFLGQFDSEFTKDYLRNEFMRGVHDVDPLSWPESLCE